MVEVDAIAVAQTNSSLGLGAVLERHSTLDPSAPFSSGPGSAAKRFARNGGERRKRDERTSADSAGWLPCVRTANPTPPRLCACTK
jgi:hypothetical protein